MLQKKNSFEELLVRFQQLNKRCRDQQKTKLKVALLADCSVQHLSQLLQVLFHDSGIDTETYEGPIGNIELEVLDNHSGLYKFAPQLVFILRSTQAFRNLFYVAKGKAQLVHEMLAKTAALIGKLAMRADIRVIHSNWVLPFERLFGNYDVFVDESLFRVVADINFGLTKLIMEKRNTMLLDLESLASWHGKKDWFDERLWFHSKYPASPVFLPAIAQAIVDIQIAATVRTVKCIVLDLDNTIWGGIVGDDGVNGIVLGGVGEGEAYVNFQNYLLELKKRGIVLAICSKNDETTARRVFRENSQMILKESDIAVFVANWDAKVDNIRAIQSALNLSFDSILFLDDNAFERNAVRHFLPDVMVWDLPEDPADYVKGISEIGAFEASSFTAEDRTRSDMYIQESQRKQAQGTFTDLGEYLRSLEMKATLLRFDSANMKRIVQLIQRSNQFNLTGYRYSEAECRQFMENEREYFPFYVSLRDKFGDYGIISIVMLKKQKPDLLIDTWLMSCRVLARGVEQYAMNFVFDYALKNGMKRVIGQYQPTDKNAMVKDFFAQFGFQCVTGSSGKRWELTTDSYQQKSVAIVSL